MIVPTLKGWNFTMTKKGLFCTLSLVVYLLGYALKKLVVTSVFVLDFYMISMFVWGFVLFMWIIDVAKICVNHYKIPVSRLY